MTVTLHRGDCLDVLRGLPEASVDAVVTDPPYGLEFMGREWDRHPSPAAYQSWCETWARACLRALKPGGYLLAFGGTRTSHRLVAGIEDAGFVIRDSLVWLYGSGFPKSLDIGKALDKAAGAEREYLGPKVYADGTIGHASNAEHEGWRRPWKGDPEAVKRNKGITVPTTDLARQWDGYGTALKPAHEPIVLAQKPLAGTYAANVAAWGCGALNIDGCRSGTDEDTARRGPDGFGAAFSDDGWVPPSRSTNGGHPAGRWPANVVLDEDAAAALDAQTGERQAGARPARRGVSHFGNGRGTDDGERLAYDAGGTSRFFYVAKASRAEREAGLDDLPATRGQYRPNDPGENSIRTRLHGSRERKNHHPTVKPLALMRWLVRLACPPGGAVLDPFAGSGTTGLACVAEGRDAILIEREAAYYDIAARRIAAAEAARQLPLAPAAD